MALLCRRIFPCRTEDKSTMTTSGTRTMRETNTRSISRSRLIISERTSMMISVVIYLFCFIVTCHATTDAGELRLKGMHNGEGIVEIRHGNAWGLICASRWTMTAGDVACRQLGYEGVTRVMRVTPGGANVDHHIDQLVVMNGTDCRGNESRLTDCVHTGFGNYSEMCEPLKLPWVSCVGADIPGQSGGVIVSLDNEAEEERSNNVHMSINTHVVTAAPEQNFPPITVQHVGSDRVTISWLHWYDRLRARDPTAYRVRIVIKYRRVDVPEHETVDSDLGPGTNFSVAAETPTYWTHYTVTGLQEQVDYEFSVESVRLSLMGGEVTERPSEPVRVRTICSGPQPVRLLRVDQQTDNGTALEVTWSTPLDLGCTAHEYVIEYQLVNKEQCEPTTTTTAGDNQRTTRLVFAGRTSTTSFVINDLHPFSTYRVFVTATNHFGRSRKVNTTKRTGETAPSDVPLNIRHIPQSGGVKLKMTWDPPACGWRGGNIQAYSYMLIDVSTDAVTHHGDADRELVILPEIDPLQRYKFLVAARTAAGMGPFAVADVPVEPDILHICGNVHVPSPVRTGPSGRISSGLNSPRGSAPWLAQLWSVGQGGMFCAGSIINEYWILTAAHCIQTISPSNLKIQLGDYDTAVPETHQRAFDVADIVVHDNFHDYHFDNDIALIKLTEPIVFSDFIRPICFPTTKIAKSMLKTGRIGMVAGWGRQGSGQQYPRYLKQVFVPVVERKTCRRSTTFGFDFTSNMFCAGYSQANLGDACEGDSGAPFVVQHSNGRWYVLGMVSWGDGCDLRDKYGYYTRLHRYTSWIKEHTKVAVKLHEE